jgi:hypothetical protein
MVLQRELVKQRRLRLLPRSHHRKSLPTRRIESATYASIKGEFFNEISPIETFVKPAAFGVHPIQLVAIPTSDLVGNDACYEAVVWSN